MGTLFIVATPIGNLEDMTVRAVRTLKEADHIAAEDTRHARILLNKYEIKTPMMSYHSYSSDAKVERFIQLLAEDKDVALISDAGTPGISDPAYSLISRAVEEGVKICPIPGPSAVLAALVMSGHRMDKFLYIGFLPLKKGRQKLLKELAEEKRTLVIYESPHRILKTLNQLLEHFGDRDIAICREITKIYEECLRMPISEAITHFETKKPKGEFVLVI